MAKKKQTRNEKRRTKPGPKPKQPKVRTANIKRTPRARRLPGMEDSGIVELENLAQDMADAAAQRKEINAGIKNLNEQLVAAMKANHKTTYSHAGIHINLDATEKAKVTITESEDDLPTDIEPAPTVEVSAEVLADAS